MECPAWYFSNRGNPSRCEVDKYWQKEIGCTECNTVCGPKFDHEQCLYYCCEYRVNLQEESIASQPRGDSVIVVSVIVCIAILLFLGGGIFCSIAAWERYKRTEDEKTKAKEETDFDPENIPHPDLRKEIAEVFSTRVSQPVNDPAAVPLLTIATGENRTGQNTQTPLLNQAGDRGVDLDLTIRKTVVNSIQPSGAQYSPLDQNNQDTMGNDYNSIQIRDPTPTAQEPEGQVLMSHGQCGAPIHRVSLRRSPGARQVRITLPPSDINEQRRRSTSSTGSASNTTTTSSSTASASATSTTGTSTSDFNRTTSEHAGPPSPNPFITEASVDGTSRPSITRRMDDAPLYRYDVLEQDVSQLRQPCIANFTAEEVGIQIRDNTSRRH